ncbi:flagellar biosynthetic protein FliR [Temperatibacter marinus]|uniref:Flagellar biosynthetic protein FliR n=1 Tax=Temperatibacter marinus TaxID=1456591 RepID=A0AA52EB84_9PROT|nr:flagellar biosynthetic protein FliR [Temperatibacter marinus]WND02147.1 flagellar biosynthetic protein FliR [Temperatibacter marinus]
MLDEKLIPEIFDYLLVLVRISALVILFPALGDRSIPGRIRASLGAVIALIAYFPLRDVLPEMPTTTWGIFWLILREFLIGAMLGTIVRIILSASHVAGTITSFMSGLGAAQSFDPNQGGQSAIVSAFLSVSTVVMIFVTDVHHLMILGLVHSYTKLPVGVEIVAADFAYMATKYVASAFNLGVQLASPFILYSLIFNTSLGLISRLIPSFQVFFIAMPFNIFMGWLLYSILFGSMLTILIKHISDYLGEILG